MTRGVCQPHSRASPVVRRGAVRRGGARRGGVAAVRRVYFVFPVSTRGEGLGLGFQLVSMGSCEVGCGQRMESMEQPSPGGYQGGHRVGDRDGHISIV